MNSVRIAWFSPFPPVKTGISGRSAELVDALRGRGYHIDTYTEQRAHDFPWRHRLEPYALVVYQFGNSSHHDYEWAYALRYPGLVVLHDTHLHHARAAFLLREKRVDDYRTEFSLSHPDVSADAAEIAIAGFDSALYYRWPLVRSLIEASRLVGVHGEGARSELIETLSTPNATTPNASKIVAIELGEGEFVSAERAARARLEVRAKYGIDQDAVLFGCFGGLTPEKRIAQILAALQVTLPHAQNARLLLAGSPARHFDAHAAAAALGVAGQVTFTGYLDTDDELTDHIAACDVSLNLRWPTARETSGPWLRALAAGKATIITDLVHLTGFASLDPRTWSVQAGTGDPGSPICVAIDILDEDHSLRLAMRRLAADADLRTRLGYAAREYWRREHTVSRMADDYERVIAEAREAGEGGPPHLRPDGAAKLRELLAPFGVPSPL
jgi:glycosyltransferase involved in cell wall biosynthesis